ncbi:MAG TPA: crosslink repair DNA glycosylase YcaQ family protein [Acidobacteriota bacterium]|nr:crosslink repair DNA glycosylase YcaQ family protein [Acidobacteriota bacterium]
METISTPAARRLAVARAGLLRPERTGLPTRAAGRGPRARAAAGSIIGRFGYLQLDTVCVTGARSHSLVLMSRLAGASPALAESLLGPGEPLFEYWGHEASWIPIELYRFFAFRRRHFSVRPWWGDLIGEHPRVADAILDQLRDRGPQRGGDFDQVSSRGGWWQLSVAKKVLSSLWSRGDVAITRRVNFQREYDLAERVIPEAARARPAGIEESIDTLLLRALAGHGWATTGTLAATWRLQNLRPQIVAALQRLSERGEVAECCLGGRGRGKAGWIRPADLDAAEALRSSRPRRDRGLLLSPFDPLLWDRSRTEMLFGFRQLLEIYKPAPKREFGYYCLPVLAGDRLIGRVDLKADRANGQLRVLSQHFEKSPASPRARRAAESAMSRLSGSLGLRLSRTNQSITGDT